MSSSRILTDQNNRLTIWRGFFALALLQVVLATALLLQDTSATGSQLILGFSLARLAIIGLFLCLFALFTWLLIRSWTNPTWTQRQIEKIQSLPQRPKVYGSLLIICGLVMLASFYTISLTPELTEPFTDALFTRLLPFTILLAGLSAQTLIVLLLVRFNLNRRNQWQGNAVFWLALVIFGLIFVFWGWVSRTSLRTESAITGWNDLGAPVLGTQVFLAWLAGMATWGLIIFWPHLAERFPGLQKLKPNHLQFFDAIMILCLWGGTILLWYNTPTTSSYFLSVPRPPNNESYPSSDALLYDLSAQSLINGQGLQFANEIFVRRPVLAVFFTFLHALGGQNTSAVIFWQIVFLAVTPVFVYLLGKSLHSRMAGIIAAVLVALRGANAIALASSITTSHAKILMADLPAMLVMVIFLYATVRWLQNGSKNLALFAGGMLGVAILIRPELGAAILAVILISFLVYRARSMGTSTLRQWLVSFLLFTLGIALVVAPWVYRNWSLTGLIFLDTPTYRTDWLQDRYQISPPMPVPTVSPASQPQSSIERRYITAPLQVTPVSASVAQVPTVSPDSGKPNSTAATSEKITNVARFVSAHYLNSQMQIFLTLPTTFRPFDSLAAFMVHRSPERLWTECCSALNYIRRLPYWHKWYGDIPTQAVVLLAINLVLIALGIQQSWKRNRWTGLLPAVLVFFHLLVNALARNSGGRYILTVDWIGMLYFSFGLAGASVWAVNLFTKERLPLEADPGHGSIPAESNIPDTYILRSPQFYLLVILLLAIGSLAPVLEKTIPPRFTQQTQSQMMNLLLDSPDLSAEQRQGLLNLLKANIFVSVGRALYPRYYQAGQGEPGSPDPLEPKDYPRLGFYLVGKMAQPIILPLVNQPGAFRNGSDALVIGCQDGQAAVVALFESPDGPLKSVFFRSDGLTPLICINPD
jgi:4-amino-4-deoxy-L-arabinose transferase-like glycosyltransferase